METKLKILVAEDNAINQMLVKKILRSAGIDFVLVDNGKMALEELEKDEYQLVFMDVNMPVMDGLECTRKIRQNTKWAGLPVIALTAADDSDDRKICFDAGMSDFLSKPFQLDKVEGILAKYGLKQNQP